MKKFQSFSVAFVYSFILYIMIVRRFTIAEIVAGVIISFQVAAVLAVGVAIGLLFWWRRKAHNG